MKRLIVLVNKVMDYEENDRKKINLILETLNISDLIKQLVETHKKKLKENKQRIKVT
jgi:hypothetical protein